MDPFTLLFLAVFVYGTREAYRSVRARSTDRAGRIEAWRGAPRGVARGTRGGSIARGSVGGRPRRAASGDHRHLHAPPRAARLGSRAAAAVTTYPALTWMLPREFYRGWRHGRVLGKHWRNNGGDLDDAKRKAADHADARGWHIPDWARPDGWQPGGRPEQAADATPDPAEETTATPDAQPATGAGQPDTERQTLPTEPTRTATAGEVTDAEIITPDPFDDLVAALYDTDRHHRTAPDRKGPTPMSDITPANTALFEGSDFDALDALGTHGQQLGEQLGEHVAEIGQMVTSYERAAENAVAEAASMRVDGATQTDIAEFQASVAETKTALAQLAVLAEQVAEAARTLKSNLAARHGAINEAVQGSAVHHAADTSFYGKPAA